MRWHVPVFITVAALLIYGNTLSAGFVWDDLLFITGRSPIQHIENIPDFFTADISRGTDLPHATPYYRPLHSTVMAVQYSLWGENSVGYHLVNLLLHTGIALLVYLLARRFGLSESAGLLAAVLYSVHPVHAEGVAYLGSSSELQYTLCLAAAMLYYLRSRETASVSGSSVALCWYVAALLTKESAITLVPLLVALETAIPSGRISARVLRLTPFALVSVFYAGLRFHYVPEIAWQEHPLSDRIFTAIAIVAGYIENLLAPFNLKVLYDVPLKLTLFRSDLVLPILGLLTLSLVIARLYRYSRRSFFFASWVLIGMVPASGLPAILLPAPMADRYLTLSLVGFALLAAQGYEVLKIRSAAVPDPAIRSEGPFRKVSLVTACAALICLGLGVLTVKRTSIWKDHETFVRRMIADAPDHFLGYELLGTIQGKRGSYSEMAGNYFMAEQKTLTSKLALGREYLELSRAEEALVLHQRLVAKFPGNAAVVSGMGKSLMAMGRNAEALAYFRTGLTLCPDCSEIEADIRRIQQAERWNN